MAHSDKIREFTDLLVWQEGHEFVLSIYRITSQFPSHERSGTVNQIQRAAVSITSNITEGFGRQSYREKTQFYFTALGSTKELHNQLIICRDLNYIDTKNFDEIVEKARKVSKMLNNLIKANRERGG